MLKAASATGYVKTRNPYSRKNERFHLVSLNRTSRTTGHLELRDSKSANTNESKTSYLSYGASVIQ